MSCKNAGQKPGSRQGISSPTHRVETAQLLERLETACDDYRKSERVRDNVTTGLTQGTAMYRHKDDGSEALPEGGRVGDLDALPHCSFQE